MIEKLRISQRPFRFIEKMHSLLLPRAKRRGKLLQLIVVTTFVLLQASDVSSTSQLPAPRGRSYATTYEQYAAFPRRRSSSPAGEMQSRAVDTSADFEVLEGQPRGTLVGFIPTKPKFTYRFNEPPREFTLDQVTGEVKTNAVLDREGMRSHYDLVVLSSQPTYPIEVRIKVLDINDNAPEFPEPSIAVSFSESAMTGTRLLLDAATDADIGENGVTDHYEIVDGNVDNKFRLVTTTNPSGDTSYLHLETTGNLDRESRGSYQLNISASDGGSPPRQGFLQVNVTILDVNDNPPIFDHSDYSVTLNETVLPGSPVLQVMASDNDLGDNSKLTYYLAETEHQFTVDPETGVISTTERLNCPQQTSQLTREPISRGHVQKSCVFTVFARDHGSPRQDGRTYVTVNLLDTNDHDPIIRFQYFPPTGTAATVDENASNGTVVAAVSVIDSDDGLNGETTTRIVSGNELHHFRLEKTPLFHIVRVNGVLDREEISKYNLTVVAIDKGTPERKAIGHLIINVNDVNDHEPVFEKSEYSAVLSELAPTGTFVASIAATDEDTGVNAQVFYEILTGNELKWFNIDTATGLIVTAGPLDREVQASVELSISARDGGPNPKFAYTQLKVTVLDENDEAPQFGQQQLNVSLSEDISPPFLVALLSATDNDQGTNGSVTFSLAPSVERLYPQQFAIDSITGQLMTRKTLDRETMANYEIFVIARDQGAPAPQSATATVYLSVSDINDNSPEFYPKHYIYTLKDRETDVAENNMRALLNVTATDRDDGDNALITYNLVSGGENIFQVDPSTGAVILSLRGDANLKRMKKPYYNLRISARDSGERRTAQDAIVEIILESKTEVLDFGTHNGYDFHVVEDSDQKKEAKLGREVGGVQIKRQPIFDNIAIEYFIVYGDEGEHFSIGQHSGRITTARRIDREAQGHYQLVIMARSINGTSSTSVFAYGKCNVHITVLDLNDNAPNFAQDRDTEFSILLPENSAVGQEIYLSRARDRDAGTNSRISYNLTYNPDQQFRINSATGVVYLQKPIRADPGLVLYVEIMATDGGTPPLSSRLSLPVHITDVNDHTPVFDHTSYETSLLETTKVNTRFFALAATDSDLGMNGRISYEIIEGNSDRKFGVFPDGYLFVRAPLDREERDYYALTVSCSDGGTPSRSSVVPVVIHVIDENDNAPQFTNSTFTFNIPENAPADTFVGKLTAVDRDIGRNAELSFSVSAQSLDFKIDTHNGFIRTLRPFDREALVRRARGADNSAGIGEEERNINNGGSNYLVLEAIVTDNGTPPLNDKVKVKVIVTDVNDNAPEFLRAPYHLTISEEAPEGTHVMHVFTQDADEGLNGDVYYTLVAGNDANLFSLDSATGLLTLAHRLDRESQEIHRLTVVAKDAALKNPLSSNASITITVLDDNDNAPEFTQSSSEISVLETSPSGTELMRFRASDADQGVNSQVVFSITAGNRRDTFHIDSISGSLYLYKTLDYEDITNYTLNITASDCGTPPLSTTVLYKVIVVDDNDNPPIFPSTAIVRQIKEGIALKTPIVTVTADDPDSGLNGKVTYKISRQEPELTGGRHFGINTQTGVIYTLRDIDRESIDNFRLTVVATDQAQPSERQLSTEKLVTVIVEDINDNAPIFVSMNAAILPTLVNGSIPPGSAGGHVMQVLARDADSSSNGLVTYEIVGGQQELFHLQRNTGIITIGKGIKTQTKPNVRYQLTLKATDEASGERKSTEAYITIITLGSNDDNDDDKPVFEKHNALFGSVYENEPIGTSILTVSAHLDSAEIEYFVTNVTASSSSIFGHASNSDVRVQVDRLFDIDAKLGILSTAVELDREAGPPSYEIEVHAIALGGKPRTARTKVQVTVLDKNDSPPQFLDTPLVYSVSEDLEIGNTIATIRASDPDPDIMSSMIFTLTDGHDGKFLLEQSTGKLQLKDTLDRETKDKYDMRIRVSDGVQYTETDFIIQVEDTNDNPPVFEESVYSFDIPENAPRGFQVGEIVAKDADLLQNAQVTYAVISDWANDVFSLNPQTGSLTLTAKLDYEEVQHYILIVQAQDNGQPSLSTTITVYCNVLDLNDNTPLFDPMSYSSEIFENVPIGVEVVTVSAKDIDSGNNGLIEFSITAGDMDNDFRINSNGTISTRRHLDREHRSSYTLTITARDCADEMAILSELKGTQLNLKNRSPRRYYKTSQYLSLQKQERLSSTVQVTILIKDVNDEAPVFVSANETSVMENVAINTVVFTVKAIDNDEGRNGYIDYFLDNDNKAAEILPFTLNPTDGILRVADALDRELRSNYVLNITARDRGDPPLATQTQLNIKILDENDNIPVFDPKQYSAAVAENASIGAMVLQVSATDMDEGDNGRVRFSIVTGDQNRDFSISEDTGVVRVAKNLNYERKSRYTLTVRAEDCALQKSASDIAELIISIIDINDNRPTFLDSPYITRVMENTVPPNDGYLLTVKAYDADTPPLNSQVRYFLKEGNADLFRINASTGEIVLLRALDRELQSEYILTLVAMDTGSPPLSNTGIVKVEVQDINDNGPVFELQYYHAIIEENRPIGSLVLKPIATDKDAGLNAKLRFNLLGEHLNHFHIDTDTGEITTAIVLDRESIRVYQLTLMAQDSSITEPRATSVNLTIIVGDTNDNVPMFEASTFSVVVPNNIRIGEFVFGLRAMDADEGVNALVAYNISGRDQHFFEVNPFTGVIRTKLELAPMKKLSSEIIYKINIHASDQGHTPLNSTAELTVQLRPVELFPIFSYIPITQFSLPEDVQPGKVIAKLAASSPKKGSIASIRYKIAGGNMGNAADVDPNTGVLTVGPDGLDYEQAHQYDIWVEAADSDRPSLRSVTLLNINVTDANDNPPVMDKHIYNAEILEEETPPQLIVAVTAKDKDSGDNGEVSYRLKNDYDGTFEIADSGEIYTTMRLDREEISDYALVVEAVDQGVPQLTGTASVLLHLLDKNDNPPKFTRLYSLNVTENAEIGSFVISVTSSDLDLGENAKATYSFSDNPSKKFKIDPKSGNITVAGQIDREQQDEYILKVVASDGAWRAETPITITIQDQNDNAPEFEHSFYSFNFPELQHAVSFVGQIIATDRDKQGPNSVISYSLQSPSPIFSVDPATGEIFSKTQIQYKHSQYISSPENMFALTILASDNGKPPLYTECLVNINIVDANNNPPKFEQTEYLAPLPEHAHGGQRVVKVHATDDMDVGVNAEIEYSLINTNLSTHFVINKHDGWISLKKGIDVPANSRFEFSVKATDRGVPPQSDKTRVIVIVTDENRYPPEFSALSYQVIVPENEPIGSTILTVSAVDKDDGPNGMLKYTISGGNERQDFNVNERTGAITIMKALDYDLLQEYHLNITVTDLGYKPLSALAMLSIILTDVNDNPPVFNQSDYHGYIAENKPVGTMVFQALATDKDSPKNAIIHYSFLPSGTDHHFFSINVSNGSILSAASFDYEERRTYSLHIKAKNPDSIMESYALLYVHILGVNEFFPQFLQPVFHFDVSETSAVGTTVGSVLATDKDIGEDGRIYYLLVGSSNDKGFGINTNTGSLHVTRNLDRETQNRVVLMVMAKNYGSIRGNDTDEAQVIISIQDGNDPPEFIKRYYTSTIVESAAVGTVVTTVKAIDKDVRLQNNQFGYSIINGNIKQAFKIDAESGVISTAALLDREDIAHYNLIIGAIDTGLPPQTGTATVHIDLEDINDNGPTFTAEGLIGYISENEPAGTTIMTLAASDPDSPENGGPFSYIVVGGKHKSLLSVDKYTGLVKSTVSYDREVTPILETIIQVEDSGRPKQQAQHKLIIKVLDQNDNPSSARTVHVTVSIFNGDVPANTKVADVHPNDVDIVGDYRCRLQGNGQLTIKSGCDLYTTSLTTPMSYAYSVTGNDGKHGDVSSKVTVDFQTYSNATLVNTLPILIRNMSAAEFLAHHYRPTLELLKSRFAFHDDVLIYSLIDMETNNASSVDVEALLVVRSSNLTYLQPLHIVDRLRERRSALSELLHTELIVGYEPCSTPEVCANGGMCSSTIRLMDSNQFRIIDTPSLILSGPRIIHDYTCQCAKGFAGEQCARRQDPCLPSPCQGQAQCRRMGNDFQCECPSNREGKQCQKERSDVCWGKPCRNGGSCQRSPDGASYFCLCRPGYRGSQCESLADSCRPNPCLHGGLCISLKPSYKCSCPSGRYGRHCERFSYGFEPLSYMTFPSLDPTTNDISIVFATTKPTALLVYNFGLQNGGRSDFLAIELVRGQAYFSSGGSRTAISTVVAGRNLADGSWHKVTATRNGRVMSLSVAKCTESGDVCAECNLNDSSCYADDVVPIGTLNFNKQPLLIGGLQSADPVLERPGQIHSDDLVGCVHSVSINGRSLNLSAPLQQQGILAGCNRQACQPSIAAERCSSYAGQCIDRWSTSLCQCGGQLLSPDCSDSLEPVTISSGGYLEFKISEQYRRMQLLDNLYNGNNAWSGFAGRTKRLSTYNVSAAKPAYYEPAKLLSFLFRTFKSHGLILYAATNQMYTSLSLLDGKLVYYSKQHLTINMTVPEPNGLNDGKWHNVSLYSESRTLHLFIDGRQVGDELDVAGVHDFLDPYLSTLSVGGAPSVYLVAEPFAGCIANFTINNELQPLNGSGSIFNQVQQHGKVEMGCSGTDIGIDAAQVADPLSIGITLVIVFFVILVVAIFGSYVIYRFRGKQEKIGSLSCGVPGFKIKHPPAALSQSQAADHVLARSIHTNDAPAVLVANTDHMRPPGHHLAGPELITKKFKERSELPSAADHPQPQQRPQRPDIIEREIVGKSPAIREEHHLSIPPPNPLHPLDHGSSVDMGSEYPEHYDLENASSIAPSDIDIVYHYKGYREAGGIRKYKATTPPVASYTHHKHQSAAAQQQHRHSPRHAVNASFVPRVPNQSNQPPTSTSTSRTHQTTPLARLSPSSELSSQQPRILTLHDISGKPLQSALLATTSSSGGVGKDALHSNSERSLNSPVMSQLSGQSSSASRQKSVAPPQAPTQPSMGLTAEEIERLNARPRTCSLVSTLDLSSSSEAPTPRVPGGPLHLSLGGDVDAHSSTSTDESGNDSFTCSEIEYDNNSLSGDGKYSTSKSMLDSRSPVARALSGEPSRGQNVAKTPPIPPHAYDGFESSFRGSLSTLVASDDDLANHLSGIYRKANGNASPSATTLGWEYLLNWGPSYENLMGVFKDIAELPDTTGPQQQQQQPSQPVSTLRIPNVQKAPEEYV